MGQSSKLKVVTVRKGGKHKTTAIGRRVASELNNIPVDAI
jgi:hypothetical protein